jgi:hypothetical protein
VTLSVAELVAGALMVPLYALLTSASYFLGSRALVTKWIWSRYPKRLDAFMLCAACSGFWYGVAVSFGIGWYLDVPFLVLPGRFWLTPWVVGLCSLVFTPWISAKHLSAMQTTTPAPMPPVDHSPEAYGTDASPTKETDLAYAGVNPFPDDDDLEEQVQQEEASLKAAEEATRADEA